jgi:Uma2 family endonuclease
MVTVEEAYLPMTLSAPGLTDAQFQEFCEQYSDFCLEYTAEGELIVMPPTDPETSARNMEIGAQLLLWSKRRRRDGIATDSSGGFTLPNGARRAPDAAWISRARLRAKQCPEFIVELLSPTDRPRRAHAKMLEWIENGVELGWLIDPRKQSVTVYRPGREPELQTGISMIAGEGPVEGFTLDLEPVWTV